MRVIEYNITADYCPNWTSVDAIREMVQNAVDSGLEFSCTVDGGIVEVRTKGTALPPQALAIGYSDKACGDIGGFGEGFKLGMLVLTRLGYCPRIHSDGTVIEGGFSYNEGTESETFSLSVITKEVGSCDLVFSCSAVGINIEELKHKVSYFREVPLPSSDEVEVIDDDRGDIFVGGLYVCTINRFACSYNIPPHLVKLGRDRDMLGDIKPLLAEHYANNMSSKVLGLILKDAEEVSSIDLYLNKEGRANLLHMFHELYGEGTKIHYVIGDSSSKEVGCNTYHTLKHSGVDYVRIMSSSEKMDEWLDMYGHLLHEEAIAELKNKVNCF